MRRSNYIFFDFQKKSSFSVDFHSWNQVIRDIRKGHGLTQTQLGQALKFSIQQIGRFEAGKVEPPIKFWQNFCRRFNINIKWALYGEGSATGQPPSDSSSLRAISTKDIENELKERKRLISAYLTKAKQARADALSDRPAYETHEVFKKRLDSAERSVIPEDAPNWLKEDFENTI